ncbi:MAG: hypothetical protein AAFV07_14950 [Bacteroidota bacterium]
MLRQRLMIVGVALVLGACGGDESTAGPGEFARQLEAQISYSMEAGGRYHKQLQAREGDQQTDADTLYASMPKVEFGADSTRPLLRQDLAYAFAPYARDSALLPYMDLEQKGDTLIATRKADADKQTPLEWQRLVADKPGGIIRYVESRIRKKSWLYRLEVDMQTQFDSLGRYQAHSLRTLTGVPLLGQTFEARVQGQMQYP